MDAEIRLAGRKAQNLVDIETWRACDESVRRGRKTKEGYKIHKRRKIEMRRDCKLNSIAGS